MVLDVFESRESVRDMATEAIAGVIFDVGDEKYILCVGRCCGCG